MCFRPKSRASMDQAPGPTIAKLAPKPANMMGIQGLAGCVYAIQTSTIAISVPASGVHKPIKRRVPEPAAMSCGARGASCVAALAYTNAQ